jgi:hypothetical protein
MVIAHVLVAALAASAIALDDRPPGMAPPAMEPVPSALESGLTLQLPSEPITSFKLIPGPRAWRDVEAILGESERAADQE